MLKMNETTLERDDIVLKKLEEVIKEVRDITSNIEQKLENFIKKADQVLKSLNGDLNQVKNTTKELEKSQEFISNQYESNKAAMNNIIKSHSEIKHEKSLLKQNITRLEKQLKSESTKRNALELHGRLNQFEINGIPICEGEPCRNIVMQVANLCDAKIKEDHIDVTHRLYGGGIIVAFKSREARDNLLLCKTWIERKNRERQWLYTTIK